MSPPSDDIADVAARARDAARSAKRGSIIVATIAVDGAPSLESLAELGDAGARPGWASASGAHATAWHPPEGPRFAALGEIARVDASGLDRIEAVRAAAAALFDRVIEARGEASTDAPSTRLFGGIAFRAEPSRAKPWTAFGDASFALPRVRLATRDARAWMSVALSAEEARNQGSFERAFAAASATLEARRTPPSERARALRLERASADVFAATVRDALRRIDEGAFEKVVPMAPCHVIAEHPLSTSRALARLAAAYPTCTRFAFQRGDAMFLGASPETLISFIDGVARADALAGTTRRLDDEALDRLARVALRESDKDLREHRAVALAVVAALEPIAREVRLPATPRLKTLRNVHHLHTPIEADLEPSSHVLDLVAKLHPTPAVAGAPRDRALAWLAEHDLESRGWYAGPVGWFDARGEGTFAVALRAGVVEGARAWLYAGAGIVAGSDPAAEYAETRAKHAPMLDALEVGSGATGPSLGGP